VVGVDLLAHTELALTVHNQARRHASEGFGEHHRGTAVDDAHGLDGPVIHRQGSLDPVRPAVHDLDAEMTVDVTRMPRIEVCDINRLEPDRAGHS
jgi:hypothetical protein